MEAVTAADELLHTALNNHERDLAIQIKELDDMKSKLTSRMDELTQKKEQIAQTHGNIDANDDDLIEINAGGRVIAAKRSTLTQLEGTRLAGLFSGRWDKKLQRDSQGRVFLDVNPICFQAIVDYLTEMLISSEDSPPEEPSVDNEHEYILQQQLKIFLQQDRADSNIIEDKATEDQLHDWLKEDDSDGKLKLLYRGSRDGFEAASFHGKCDGLGPTLTIIKTTSGHILGGYSNIPWKSGSGEWGEANKAYLFLISGTGVSSPQKMKLKGSNSSRAAIYYSSHYGPTFGEGHDLNVLGYDVTNSTTKINLFLGGEGSSYCAPLSIPVQLNNPGSSGYTTMTIEDIEVFQVKKVVPHQQDSKQKAKISQVVRFSEDINEAINTKIKSLAELESEIQNLEESFHDEQSFVISFTSGETKDVVVLNVNGTIMATKRSALCSVEESSLAQQFDDTKWTEQGLSTNRVKEWTPDEVCDWAKKVEGIQEDVGSVLKENNITGCELLTLKIEGLKMIGIERAGTLCLLLEEIKKLKQSSQDTVTLIEHSPYCFGKILDYLRLKNMQCQGLIDAETSARPIICESQKKRFSKVVQYYFPGDSAKIILPDPPSPVGFSFGTAAAAPVAQSFYFGAPP